MSVKATSQKLRLDRRIYRKICIVVANIIRVVLMINLFERFFAITGLGCYGNCKDYDVKIT
jgi:hypothetical protein